MEMTKIRLYEYADRKPIITCIVVLILRIILAIIFTYLPFLFDQEPLSGSTFGSIQEEFLIVVCVAPLAETSLFQYAPYKILHKHIRLRYVILSSSVLFASMHYYSMLYFINGFIAGFLYSSAFCLLRNSRPFIFTSIIHIVYNLISFIYNHL